MANDYIVYIILIIIIISLIGISMNNKREHFIDKYYYWNWSDPELIKKINNINDSSVCAFKNNIQNNCLYSMSCDYTDDALPYCYRSLDIPSYDKKNNLFRSNSY